MLKYFVTEAQFILVKEEEVLEQCPCKVRVPVNLQREDSLQCSARVFYEDEAFEAVYLLAIKLGQIFKIIGLGDCLLTVRFPSLPWEVVDTEPTDALIVPNDAQCLMETIAAYKVNKLADFFWEINKELD